MNHIKKKIACGGPRGCYNIILMTCSNSLDKKLLKVIKEENFKDFD